MGYLPSNESANPALNKSSKGSSRQTRPNELEVDSTGRAPILSQTAPTPGSDIYLSIDADLQAATESYLRKDSYQPEKQLATTAASSTLQSVVLL